MFFYYCRRNALDLAAAHFILDNWASSGRTDWPSPDLGSLLSRYEWVGSLCMPAGPEAFNLTTEALFGAVADNEEGYEPGLPRLAQFLTPGNIGHEVASSYSTTNYTENVM